MANIEPDYRTFLYQQSAADRWLHARSPQPLSIPDESFTLQRYHPSSVLQVHRAPVERYLSKQEFQDNSSCSHHVDRLSSPEEWSDTFFEQVKKFNGLIDALIRLNNANILGIGFLINQSCALCKLLPNVKYLTIFIPIDENDHLEAMINEWFLRN